MSSEPVTRNVVVTRIFGAPVERVWRAWTDPNDVMQWWGPTGFTCPIASIDFREGGTSLTCMRAPAEYGGQDMYNTWTYTRIEPNLSIEYIFRFSDKDGNQLDPASIGIMGVPSDVRQVVTFKDAAPGKTEMTVTEYGYTSDEAHDMSKAGLEQCLDKMEKVVTAP
jgi:uncharacterized protein YndB with AHSA1/START domain